MAKAAVKAYVANVVRCGIMPKPLPVKGGQRKLWVKAWDGWAKRDADLTRVQHFYELQALWLEEVIVGGGCLVHFVQLPPSKARRRKLPLAVELIPEERFCEEGDLLGVGITGKLDNGNRVARGVEYDPVTGEHVAYWLKPSLPNDLYPSVTEKPARIPADQCIYGFNRTRVGQHRGFTLLAAVITYLSKLGYYTDNELMASAVRSCVGLVIESDGDSFPALNDASSAETSDVNGNPLDRMEPGMIAHLKPGEKINGVNPNVPPGDAAVWIKLIQRSIAVGMDLSYFGMMRDTAESNFAGFRAGLNEDRSRYEMWQDRVVHKLAEPTWERFTRASVLAGTDGFPTPSEFASDPDTWTAAEYQVPGWPSVTPLDDARADEINIAIGTTTRGRIIGARGYDLGETFEELSEEKKLAADLDIDVAAEPDAALPQDQVSSEDRR